MDVVELTRVLMLLFCLTLSHASPTAAKEATLKGTREFCDLEAFVFIDIILQTETAVNLSLLLKFRQILIFEE